MMELIYCERYGEMSLRGVGFAEVCLRHELKRVEREKGPVGIGEKEVR